ncbi:MAG: imidazolonepropionase, partial [Desulfobacterales bacterium]
MNGNLIIKNAAEVVTCSGFAAKKGREMADLKIIHAGAVLIKDGIIEAVGQSRGIEQQLKKADVDDSIFDIIDARGKA